MVSEMATPLGIEVAPRLACRSLDGPPDQIDAVILESECFRKHLQHPGFCISLCIANSYSRSVISANQTI